MKQSVLWRRMKFVLTTMKEAPFPGEEFDSQ
jgi:hypothetical protein